MDTLLHTAHALRHHVARAPSPTLRIRRALGMGIAFAGAGVIGISAVEAVIRALAASPALAAGVGASALAGLATGLGAVAILALRGLSRRQHDGLLGASAGVMLAAAVFSLLLPALDTARELAGTGMGSAALVAAGLALGAAVMAGMDRALPHAHFVKHGEAGARADRSGNGLKLVVFAIALHNLPEGMAVGASYGGDGGLGAMTAIGIGLQNMPEGLVVATALATLGRSVLSAIAVATLTGLIEPAGALLGGALAGLAAPLLPIAMAFAAGAMLFVISHEMVPESHRSGNEGLATGGLVAGFTGMMLLSAAF